ncbi:hypothetical protein niasHT_001871 [Heterodera trifolii]|uniref:F-box associated domain-containing protein n=1 Tax=Heterodera trifolii TaxID=157864 RepID=A0ABD2LR78_9BILA
MNPWICNDVVMDILPFFERVELGLKLAMLSDRFDVLVDAHFDGKSELLIWRRIAIHKDNVTAVPKLSVLIDYANSVPFPLPDHSLHNKIRFKSLQIWYIDHSVIAFLRANQQIWDKDTNLSMSVPYVQDDQQRIWRVFVREIWPIFAPHIRHLSFYNGGLLLDNLCRFISPTILTDLNIISIYSGYLLHDATDDFDEPNTIPTAGQMLSKWLHTPTKDGQPKRLHCFLKPPNIEWANINTLKKKFLNATTSVHYKIQFIVRPKSTQIVPFELANERTKEKLTLIKASENHWDDRWIMKRCQNGETADQWEFVNFDDLNIVTFVFYPVNECVGPLSAPPAEEEEAGQSSEKEGQSSEKEGQSSEKEGQSSEKEGQSSEKEGQSSEKGESSDK